MSDPRRVLRKAAERVHACRDLAAEPGQACFRDGYRLAIEARNQMLQGDAADRLRSLNALLSLMSSVQFPLAGVHRDRIEAAARGLDALLEGAGPTTPPS